MTNNKEKAVQSLEESTEIYLTILPCSSTSPRTYFSSQGLTLSKEQQKYCLLRNF